MQLSSIPNFLAGVLLTFWCSLSGAMEFQLQLDSRLTPHPYSGRVYLFFSSSGREPRLGPDWFRPQPFCALNVQNWQPGTVLSITGETPGLISFPAPLGELDLSGMQVQAVVRLNPWERKIGSGPGNGYSSATNLPAAGPLQLVVDQRVPEPVFPGTGQLRELRVRSQLLSEFHQRDVSVQGAVLLPESYAQSPEKRYPVIFEIPGFGGTHFDIARRSPKWIRSVEDVEFIYVLLDPSCPLGHHVFADSANNGPWGTALVTEFLPQLDREFRTDPRPAGRFLTGHSSGGWSSLWLQVAYPAVFGGTWSTAPDPVDFEDFQLINLLADENMYRDAAGARRPLARMGGQIVLWYEDFCRMEDALGYGGQLHSFEAVFSPRDPVTGKPQLLWDRSTGKINHAVAQAWETYNIRRKLEQEWATLGPQLSGKLTVIMGEEDTFLLEGATRRLQQSLRELGSDARVELVPERDHFNLLSPELYRRLAEEMAAKYRQSL
jgi:hypothetical protein